MRGVWVGVGAGMFLLAAMPVLAESEAAYRWERLVYAEPENHPLRMTLYMPDEDLEEVAAPRPAVVLMHGGAWTVGLRQQFNWFCERLAENGYVAATIDYRLMPRYAFPEPVHDAKAAVRWLRLNADQYAIDPERIGAMGMSAGGHLAAFLAVTGSSEELEGSENLGSSSEVQAAVSFYAPFDLTYYEEHNNDGVVGWIGSRIIEYFVSTQNGYDKHGMTPAEAASPINYAGADASPILFIHGTEDGIVPFEQSQAFHERLKKLDVPTALIKAPDQRHGFARYPSVTRDKIFNDILAFLERHLNSPATTNTSPTDNPQAKEKNS